MSIVTLPEAKQQLGITTTAEDDELTAWIDGIAVPVENYLHEIVVPREVDEDIDVCSARRFWLRNSPVISLTSLISLDGLVTYDVTKLKVRPSGLVRVISGPSITGTVTATYQAGYDPIPPNIRQGALVILQHVWESQRGAAGASAGVLGPEELVRSALSTYTIPRKAEEWLGVPTTLAR